MPQSPTPPQAAYGQPPQTSYGQPPQASYGQPLEPAVSPAPLPQAYAPAQTEGRPWIVAIVAALAAGALLAFAYAAISYAIGREILIAIIAIGAVIGLVVRVVSRRPGTLSGAIAALVAVPATLAAVILLVVFYAADSIPDGLSALGDVDYSVALKIYFNDALGYVWFAASIIFAFIGGRKGAVKA